jgi:hypothetical protein
MAGRVNLDKPNLEPEVRPGNVVQAPRIVFRAQSAKIPFSPVDEIIIDEVKVTVRQKVFMTPTQTRAVRVGDVANVSLTTGPLFGSLAFSERGFTQDVVTVKRLWRDDAIHARRVLGGLAVLAAKGTDLSKLSIEQIIDQAEKSGAVVEVI